MNKIYKILVNTLAPSIFANGGLRKKILKLSGFKIGSGSRINSGFHFDSNNVWIGNNVVINHFFNFFDAGKNAKLIIEDNVFIGPNCHIVAMSHEIGTSVQRAGKTYAKDITIERGAWIGADVKILPGITIGSGCVIGVGSVVTKDTEKDSLYVGVPARKVKNI
ncbi:acyltransferase [Weissella confusa]|uniref:acyltransferase n=1 Tax=Weissella confusa TaxID=1583 RepID=UPI0022E1EBDF|nr:DapH/DapD/GlmU-related protein [Weissella confusa]